MSGQIQPHAGQVVAAADAGRSHHADLSLLLPDHDVVVAVDGPAGLLQGRNQQRNDERAAVERAEAARAAQHEAELAAAYQRGLDDGRAAADAEGVAAVRRIDAAVATLRAQSEQLLPAQLAADTSDLLEAALEVARWVLGRELTTDPAALLPLLTRALEQVAPGHDVHVHVSAQDAAMAREWERDIAGSSSLTVLIETDPHLEPGQARLTAGSQRSEVSITEALRRAHRAMTAQTG